MKNYNSEIVINRDTLLMKRNMIKSFINELNEISEDTKSSDSLIVKKIKKYHEDYVQVSDLIEQFSDIDSEDRQIRMFILLSNPEVRKLYKKGDDLWDIVSKVMALGREEAINKVIEDYNNFMKEVFGDEGNQ